ncbi:hypothetical protein AB0F96_29870 [Streptomyces sp. NPDC023998]|uniref:hypothetical protein n=1 Tax=Streptomyces sp. NPDC023998 TaxID=3154597 RepID=UPI0033ED14AB
MLPLTELREQWRTSAIGKFGAAVVDGPLTLARRAAAAIRKAARPFVDVALAAVDVAAVVYVIRGQFARRHLLAEARRHLAETLRGQPHQPGLDDWIVDVALRRHARPLTRPQPGRRPPPPDLITHTATWHRPRRWWVSTPGGRVRESTAYERAQIASRALSAQVRTAPTRPASAAVKSRTTDPATWMRSPENLARFAAFTQQADARKRQAAARMENQAAGDAAAPRPGHDQRAHQQPDPGPASGQRQR